MTNHLYNEINPYRARVLRTRMAEGRLPKGIVDERSISDIPDEDFQRFDCIHLFAGIGGFPLGLRLAGIPEAGCKIVTGGFPCQDISNAGKRAGISGTRSGLWREMARCIRVVQPDFVFVENVAALLGRGMERVLGDLAEIGYDARWDRVSAAEVGAWHLRERIWVMAYRNPPQWGIAASGNVTNGHDAEWEKASSGFASSDKGESADASAMRGETFVGDESDGNVSLLSNAAYVDLRGFETSHGIFAGQSELVFGGETSAHDDFEGQTIPQGREAITESTRFRTASYCDWWATEPNVDRMVYGLPARVERLAALGDAIVPQACAEAIRRLTR